jgi:hypothetical protein
MIEAGNVLGVLSAGLLLIAIIAWVKVIRRRPLQRTDGSTQMDAIQGELASKLLFWAATFSGAAAFLAVAGWIFK